MIREWLDCRAHLAELNARTQLVLEVDRLAEKYLDALTALGNELGRISLDEKTSRKEKRQLMLLRCRISTAVNTVEAAINRAQEGCAAWYEGGVAA